MFMERNKEGTSTGRDGPGSVPPSGRAKNISVLIMRLKNSVESTETQTREGLAIVELCRALGDYQSLVKLAADADLGITVQGAANGAIIGAALISSQQRGNDGPLYDVASNARVSNKNREKAALVLVERYMRAADENKVTDFVTDNALPIGAREHGERWLVDRYVTTSDTISLHSLATDPHVPAKIRKESCLALILLCVDTGDYKPLVSLQNAKIPFDLSIALGSNPEKAVRRAIELAKNDPRRLMEISCDADVPKELQLLAKKECDEARMRIGKDLPAPNGVLVSRIIPVGTPQPPQPRKAGK